jgi:preprotein translocase subunit YajC
MKVVINYIVPIIILILAFICIYRGCSKTRQKEKEHTELINSLEDRITVWIDANQQSHAKISVIETENTKLFTQLQLKDEELVQLQEEVKKYKDRLKEQGSITLFKTETKFDTIYRTNIDYTTNNWCDTVNNNWMYLRYCIEDSNAKFNLNIRNEYEVIIGREKKLTYAEVINKNPYTETTSVRTYQVSLPKQKRFGVGPTIGVGLTHDLKFRCYLGIGLHYNIIQF